MPTKIAIGNQGEAKMLEKPEISDRFDVEDIRKIRDYNSYRHSKMTREEIIEDIRSGAQEIIDKYGLKVTYVRQEK